MMLYVNERGVLCVRLIDFGCARLTGSVGHVTLATGVCGGVRSLSRM